VRADLDYVAGVAQAGGVPVVLPPIAEVAEGIVRGIDGLLLSGGSDLDPGYYGEELLPELGAIAPERDTFEVAVLRHALERGMPVFGICRGLQVLNVALGGTLYQDLPSQLHPDLIAHRQQMPKWQWTHEVEVGVGSEVAKIMESTDLRVNSYHHQAIKDLADDLVAVAHASDGVIEAVESRDLSERWLVGVQWHAEAMREAQSPEHRNLFKAHVAAAERHALGRAAA
jgi:putative glutamine amidotransferase